MTTDSMHVFWIRPLPGVTNTERVIVAMDNTDQTSVVVVLPDNTQVLITADRAVCFRGNQMLVLSSWQYSPVSPDEYYQETGPPPEVPEAHRLPGAAPGQGSRWDLYPGRPADVRVKGQR